MMKRPISHGIALALVVSLLVFFGVGTTPARADETCQSPFLPKVTGQEDYIYVWTLGIKGVADGNDSMVTVDANPKSPSYGKIVHRATVPGQHEAHHAGFTDDRRFLWAGGLDTSQIFVFDVGTDPAKPKLVKTISTFVKDTGGLVGPHTFYALPGRMLISALSNSQDGSGRTGLAEYSNDGKFIRTIWMPKEAPYGYDVRVNANLNRMLTSSFTGKKNYMRPFGELTKDAEAMKQFGDSVVVWDFHARKPLQILRVPGAPLELRWALLPNHNYAFTATALTGQLVLIYQQEDGTWASKNIAEIGANIPVDISIAPDDSKIYVNSFGDGSLRVYDVSNPHEGKLVETVSWGRWPTWCRRRGTANVSTPPTRSSPSGTSPATTGSRLTRGRRKAGGQVHHRLQRGGAGAHHELREQDLRPARRAWRFRNPRVSAYVAPR